VSGVSATAGQKKDILIGKDTAYFRAKTPRRQDGFIIYIFLCGLCAFARDKLDAVPYKVSGSITTVC
jgi:hypothetical protein